MYFCIYIITIKPYDHITIASLKLARQIWFARRETIFSIHAVAKLQCIQDV